MQLRTYVKAIVSAINVNVEKDIQDGHVVRFSISILSFMQYYHMGQIVLWIKIWAYISCFQLELWRLESSQKFCQGGVLHDNIDSQQKCQELCTHTGFTGCFGVAYFEMAMKCYVCNDYNIVSSGGNENGGHFMDSDGFYRHQRNKELICFTTIFNNTWQLKR